MSNLIGNAPNQVPTNGDLGDLAYQDANYASIGNVTISANATISNLSVVGSSTMSGNIQLTSGNIILNPVGLNSSANSVQPKSYTDAMSIVFGI
jgi:hypothetical protein